MRLVLGLVSANLRLITIVTIMLGSTLLSSDTTVCDRISRVRYGAGRLRARIRDIISHVHPFRQ